MGNFNKAYIRRQLQGAAPQGEKDSMDTFLNSLTKIKSQLACNPKG